MADNSKFQVRDTKEELERLDKALKIMDYKDRADWYRDKKRELFREVEQKNK